MKQLLIVTACLADNNSQINKLETSCQKLGLDFKYFGVKTVFRNWKQAKVDMLVTFLQEQKDYEYILYTDGFDSWMLADEEEILEKFKAFQAQVVLAGERDCYPLSHFTDSFPETNTPFRFPCAGQFIGKREPLIEILSMLSSRYNSGDKLEWTNDQALWMSAFSEGNLKDCRIDSECNLFVSMNGYGKDDIIFDSKTKRLTFMPVVNTPCAIHFNGPKIENYPDLMEKTFRQCFPS